MKTKYVGNWKLKKTIPQMLMCMWDDINKQNKGLEISPIDNLWEFSSTWGIVKDKVGDKLDQLYGVLISIGIYAERNKLVKDMPIKSVQDIKTKKLPYLG
jgi:hypothetical protein